MRLSGGSGMSALATRVPRPMPAGSFEEVTTELPKLLIGKLSKEPVRSRAVSAPAEKKQLNISQGRVSQILKQRRRPASIGPG